MAGLFGLEKREVVRIKVKKTDGLMQPEYKKLSVDPQLTSYEILQHLLVKAFNIKGDFTISYLARDDTGEELYLSLLSDWDLDAAFLSASDPCLRLKVDLKPFEEGLEDWDVIAPVDIPQSQRGTSLEKSSSFINSLTGSISSQVGKTMSQMSKVMGLKTEEDEKSKPKKQPMSDAEFHNFLDEVGHMIRPQEFRFSVYQGGVEPSLRKVVWRHLLNVYPQGMTGKERFEYLKKKTAEYNQLRDEWHSLFSQGKETEEIRFVTNMVKKDVLRTDRTHQFYAGSDENKNVLSLFNLLVTYAMTHPEVSYCQGMSDLASPLLVVQEDEAHAYICFCGLMKRLKANFLLDGEAMTRKFEHLSLILQHRDPDFYAYLKYHGAEDMFFCYRWLLLELKREFPFDDALKMLEVMWSSLPPDASDDGIELIDSDYNKQNLTCSPGSANMNQNAYIRLRSLRRQPSGNVQEPCPTHTDAKETKPAEANGQLNLPDKSQKPIVLDAITPCDEKDLDPKDYLEMEDCMTQSLINRSSLIDHSLETPTCYDENVISSEQNGKPVTEQNVSPLSLLKSAIKSIGIKDTKEKSVENGIGPAGDNKDREASEPVDVTTEKDGKNNNNKSDVLHPQSGSPKRPSNIPLKNTVDSDPVTSSVTNKTVAKTALTISANGVVTEKTAQVSSCEEVTEGNPSIDFIKVQDKLPKLPPPHIFGDGNPYLIFLCLTLLVQQRDYIIKNRMDYNELAMHFDKMVRKHKVQRVLHQAQSLYAVYLRSLQNSSDSEENSDAVSI